MVDTHHVLSNSGLDKKEDQYNAFNLRLPKHDRSKHFNYLKWLSKDRH